MYSCPFTRCLSVKQHANVSPVPGVCRSSACKPCAPLGLALSQTSLSTAWRIFPNFLRLLISLAQPAAPKQPTEMAHIRNQAGSIQVAAGYRYALQIFFSPVLRVGMFHMNYAVVYGCQSIYRMTRDACPGQLFVLQRAAENKKGQCFAFADTIGGYRWPSPDMVAVCYRHRSRIRDAVGVKHGAHFLRSPSLLARFCRSCAMSWLHVSSLIYLSFKW
jgi:hypothetical protein